MIVQYIALVGQWQNSRPARGRPGFDSPPTQSILRLAWSFNEFSEKLLSSSTWTEIGVLQHMSKEERDHQFMLPKVYTERFYLNNNF